MKLLAFVMAVLAGLGTPLAEAAERGDRVVDEGKIGDQWMLAEGAALAGADYPPRYLDSGADVCVALGYRIKPDGTTSDFEVLKQWSSSGDEEPSEGFWEAFAHAGAGALSQWRFQPKPGVGVPRPTYTVATFGFTNGTEAKALAEVRRNCVIGDLAAHLKRTDREGLEWGRYGRRESYEASRAADQARNEAVIREAQSRQASPPPGQP